MEIENLIEKLRDAGWTNPGLTDKQSLEWDAAAALEQLQAENDRLKRERDAAVNDLNILRKRSGWKCYACFYDNHYDRGVCAGCGYNNDNNWQWRGQKEE